MPDLPRETDITPPLDERIIHYQKVAHAEHMHRIGEIAERLKETNRRLSEVVELLKDMAQGLA